ELTKATASAKERYKKIVLDQAASGAPESAKTDRSGFGCHRRSAAWKAGRTFLPWLLRTLLLFATLHFLWGVSVMCPAAGVEHRCAGRERGRAETDREADSFRVPPSAPPRT